VFTACGTMHRRSCLLVTRSPAGKFFGALYPVHQQAASLVHFTTSCKHITEDGRNYREKHVKLIAITNKLLLLHLVGSLYCCIREGSENWTLTALQRRRIERQN